MKINVKEEVVLEREIDVEDLLCVLKHESETDNCTVRVDKGLLNDAALVIKRLLDLPKVDIDVITAVEMDELKDTITKLEEQLEGCTKSFNDSIDVNRNLTDENERLRKANEEWLNINEAIVKTNEELLGEVKKLESEKEMLKKMLSRKSPYEPPKVSLDKAKEAKDKVDIVELIMSDFKAMDALAGILLHGLAL